MKVAFLLLALGTATSAHTIRSDRSKLSLLSKSRRIEEAAQDDDQSSVSLANYALKLIGCANGEAYTNLDGEIEYGAVIFRLCPADTCKGDSAKGCKKGYGDYIVGLNSFVESWLEDKKDDLQQDDAFKVEQFGECREYQVDNDDDSNQAVYYVGPTCSGSTIKLGFFSDYTCTSVPEDVTFEDISNGWTLPYSTSGLVTGSCEACASYQDNGNVQVSDMCTNLWESAGKCEENMEYSGKDTTNCQVIASLMPASHMWAIIGLILLVLIVIGVAAYAYTIWWMDKKKQGDSPRRPGFFNRCSRRFRRSGHASQGGLSNSGSFI